MLYFILYKIIPINVICQLILYVNLHSRKVTLQRHNLYVKFVQCMRQLYDERDMTRAWNGLNYLFIIIAFLARTAFELKKGNTWKILALITSSIAAIQNTYWDIFMDWGLLKRHSKNPYLRDKLVLPHKSVYFIAMVTTIIHLKNSLKFIHFASLYHVS